MNNWQTCSSCGALYQDHCYQDHCWRCTGEANPFISTDNTPLTRPVMPFKHLPGPDPKEAEYRTIWIECAMRRFAENTSDMALRDSLEQSFKEADTFIAELKKRDGAT